MSFVACLSSYLTLNLLLILGIFTLKGFALMMSASQNPLKARTELQLHYFFLKALLVILLASLLLPQAEFFHPVAKIWSAPSLHGFSQEYSRTQSPGYLRFSERTPGIGTSQVAWAWAFGLGLLFLAALAKAAQDLLRLHRLRRHAFLWRKIGRCSVFVSEAIQVPFSYHLFNQAHVVIPQNLLAKSDDFKMALAHELQHHRQKDTLWVYAVWGLRLLCLPNLVLPVWNRWLCEIQEFACDETLVDLQKVKSRDYARCLVEVAETALQQSVFPVGATGLNFLTEGPLLKRRIQKMLYPNANPLKKSLHWVFTGLLVSLMAATAVAAKSLVQDRRISFEQAQSMAKAAELNSGFPIVINQEVLKELNRYLGTPEGRDFLRQSLQRMNSYKPMIEDKIHQYQVPEELLAIPIVESGYQNRPQDPHHKTWGAGIWMFIETTARNWGLQIDDQVDQRLDADLLTDAAFRYLKSNQLLFKDWPLAVLAYNVGENSIRQVIQTTGIKDAWGLIHAGYENDRDYLAQVEAVMLILKNPDCLQ